MTVKQKQLLLCCFDLLPLEGVDGIWGRQSEAATRKLQVGLDIPSDGLFGEDTLRMALDALAEGRTLSGSVPLPQTGTFWEEIEFFSREEFRCQCGGKYCSGFPVEPEEALVRTIDEIRRRLGVPVSIVDSGGSGVRCLQHNADVGGVANSLHLTGNAADLHSGKSAEEMARTAEEVMGSTGEIGVYPWGIHVGIGKYSRFRG